MSQRTNAERADAARRALAAYHNGPDEDDPPTRLTDLLTDLQHLADCDQIDFDAALHHARFHHTVEVAEAHDNRVA